MGGTTRCKEHDQQIKRAAPVSAYLQDLHLIVSDALQEGTEQLEHLQNQGSLVARSKLACRWHLWLNVDRLPKAVTERVAHQGKPVNACSPSIRLTAPPTGPS